MKGQVYMKSSKVVIKIKGVLLDILVQMDPVKCGPNVVHEKGKKVLYLKFLKAIYGML